MMDERGFDIGDPTGPDEMDDIEIETVGYTEPALAESADPRRGRGAAAERIGSPGGEPGIIVRATAFEQIIGHVANHPKTEVAGVLLGRYYLNRGSRVTDVEAVFAAPDTRAGVSHVTFSHDTWTAIFDEVSPEEGQTIVGWYHSHPGFGCFLSRQDLFIHEYFFDYSGHVALVLDPVRHAIGAFKWVENKVKASNGLWVVAADGDREKVGKFAKMLTYKISSGDKEPGGIIHRFLDRR